MRLLGRRYGAVGALYTPQQRNRGGCLLLCFVSLHASHSMYFFPFAVRWSVGVEGVEVLKLKREGVIKCFFKMFGLLGR